MEQEEAGKLDLGSLGSFDFTPAWAKKDAKVSVGKFRPMREETAPGDRKGGGIGRKPFGDKPFGNAPSARGFGGAGKKPFERRPRFEERPKPLDVEVKILPETKALGTIIRKLQGDFHAYKLKDLAYFFLDNPQSVLLKVSPKAPQAPQPQPSTSTSTFFQCKACGFASTSREEVVQHVLTSHLGDYYDAKEIDCEPPKGNFNCVAKCGLSGVLLGPPNIHEFNDVVREMIRTKYPDMSEAQYRSHIEMVRDADSIEAWRKSATRKTVFFVKGEADKEGAAQLTRAEAEGSFKRNILDSLVDSPKNLMITADMALKSPVKPLVWAVRDALEAERRSPYAMCFALRGAFHHRKLNFFRANDSRGQEFVTSVEYKEFDAKHAIPELAKVSNFVKEHPCATKQEIAPDAESEKHLQWLVSTGHVVAFTNGVFSPVEKFPKYGPQWRKAAKKEADAADKPVDAASSPRQDKDVEDSSGRGLETASTEGEGRGLETASTGETGRGLETASTEEQTVVEEKKDESTAQLAE